MPRLHARKQARRERPLEARGSALIAAATLASLLFGCGGTNEEARTLFALGDSYTVLSTRFLFAHAERAQCPARRLDLARNGWTAREMLGQRDEWLPALRDAPAPVVVFTTVGYNDMMAPRSARKPDEAADDARWLIEMVGAEIGAAGGTLIQISYDDVWMLPAHPIYFDGVESTLDPRPSALLDAYYRALSRTAASSYAFHRLVDVRGWLGDRLWTDDGVHMRLTNYDDQAHLLWNRVFHSLLGCEALPPLQPRSTPVVVSPPSGQ